METWGKGEAFNIQDFGIGNLLYIYRKLSVYIGKIWFKIGKLSISARSYCG
jgi:hypothetical protein